MSYHCLAQLNIARLIASLDDPVLSDFVANLERINALAERSPGFVWRLQTDEGDATSIRHFGDDVIVNLSVWQDVASLSRYVYQSAHMEVLRRRREWFCKRETGHLVLWWIPSGHRPTLAESEAKLELLRARGPSAAAFTFRHPFAAPGASAVESGMQRGGLREGPT